MGQDIKENPCRSQNQILSNKILSGLDRDKDREKHGRLIDKRLVLLKIVREKTREKHEMNLYGRGKNPHSLKNLKPAPVPGPGRRALTSQEKMINKEIRQYLREYLENGEAIKDFQQVRKKKPEVALKEAMDRIYGKIDKPEGNTGNSKGQINLLVQILTGKSPQNEMIQTNPTALDIPVTSDSHDGSLPVDIENSG